MYNILFIEKTFGLDLPKWTDAVFPQKLLALAERNLAVLTENDYMKRVRGGKYISSIQNSFVFAKCERNWFDDAGDVTFVCRLPSNRCSG